GVDFLKNKGYDIHDSLTEVPDQPSFKEIQAIAKKAIDLYNDEIVDEVKIYYSHFVSVLENTPSMKTVLPLSPEDSSLGHGQMSSYEFEPDKEAILSVILPQYVESLIYGTILDAKASEHATRMTAMKMHLIMRRILLMIYLSNITELDKQQSRNKSQKLLVAQLHLNND